MQVSSPAVGAPKPANEAERLAALYELEVLDTAPEEVFDHLTALVAELLQVPIALISLVDADRQWFKSRIGLDASETPREHAFCAWAVHEQALLHVEDASRDPRFESNPLVTGAPSIRFYAGAPLATESGVLGTLCAIGSAPRTLSDGERALLNRLAQVAVSTLKQRRSEVIAMRRTQLLELAAEIAAVGHWRVDPVRERFFWSEQVYRIHGVDPESFEPTLQAGVDFFHPEDRSLVEGHLERAVERNEHFDFELRLVRADDEVRLVRSIGRPEVDANGSVTGLFGVFQDVTEERELQRRLSQAEKMASIGTLAAGVAHEINNPLTYIAANTQVLAEEIDAWAGSSPSSRLRELKELVEEVRQGNGRIRKIVNGLKSFARGTEEAHEVVEVARVVEIAARLCSYELRHKATFSVENEAAEHPATVLANEGQLVQVVVNLIVNAAHAIEIGAADHNTVVARIGREGELIVLTVEDSGSGMKDEVLREVFTPFYTTKPHGVGTGLGLSICHGIVQSFGGRIEIESTLGVGTRVRVLLPAASAAATLPPQAPSQPTTEPPLDRAKILIIDDDAAVGRAMTRVLRAHEVTVVVDAAAALDAIRSGERYDVVLLDFMMPRMSGDNFHRALMNLDADLGKRSIVVTGGGMTPSATDYFEGSGVTVLEKPINFDRLRSAIAAALRRE